MTSSNIFPASNFTCHESLIRVIIAPDHLDNGKLTYTAISSKDILERGLSVHRMLYLTKEILEVNVQKLLERNPERTLHALALINYGELLEIKDTDGEEVFHAKYDPLPDNISHAIILCNKRYSKSSLMKFRETLIKKITTKKSIIDIFE